jgi:hypothetical protein
MDMACELQNIRRKGLTGKIFRKKELAAVFSRRVAMIPIDRVGETLRTVRVWAFHILGQGCSSQAGGIFLWKAVENYWERRVLHPLRPHRERFDLGFQKRWGGPPADEGPPVAQCTGGIFTELARQSRSAWQAVGWSCLVRQTETPVR